MKNSEANTGTTLSERAKHLQWCKERALEYVDKGDVSQAYASFVSDMGKHESTANHPAMELGHIQLFSGMLSTPAQMRSWIEGFN